MDAFLSSVPVWLLVVLGLLLILELALDVIALVDLYRRPAEQLIFANKWVWLAIILLVNTVGAIIYLVVARKPVVLRDDSAPAKPKSVGSEEIADILYGPRDDTDRP